MGIGALLFIPAAAVPSYPLSLFALMVLAGCSKPLFRGVRPRKNHEPLEPGTSFQFIRNRDCSLCRWFVYIERGAEKHGRYSSDVVRPAARLSITASVFHQASLLGAGINCHRPGNCDRGWRDRAGFGWSSGGSDRDPPPFCPVADLLSLTSSTTDSKDRKPIRKA